MIFIDEYIFFFTDFEVCANGIEILAPDQIQDGFPDCYDRSDELMDDLGKTLLADSSELFLTSGLA